MRPLQLALCLGFAFGAHAWRQNNEGAAYYLALQEHGKGAGNYAGAATYVMVSFFTFW